MHPLLQKAKDQLLSKQAEQQKIFPNSHLAIDKRHREILETWIVDGVMPNENVTRYFRVYYCPECKAGRIGDLTYDKPEGKSAQELGIIKKKVWASVCPGKE